MGCKRGCGFHLLCGRAASILVAMRTGRWHSRLCHWSFGHAFGRTGVVASRDAYRHTYLYINDTYDTSPHSLRKSWEPSSQS